ncbi:MAG TPA: hypothetical protein DDZ67_10175 [Xanthomonadaceae bacterium]|nr:hypothetical protein [Xanthomonadaceae bacterium]
MSEQPKSADVVSLGGSRILRHGAAADWRPADGEMCLERISAHIERYLGPVDAVFHEIVSDAVHIDVHIVAASAGFPYLRLVTSGMSDLPMAVPADVPAPRHLELMITLPGDWPLAQQDLSDERHYWPIRLLKTLARLPHRHATWLGYGHTVPHGDPAEPYAGDVGFAGAIVLPSISVPDGFAELVVDADKTIAFMAVVPLYPEEMALKLHRGTDALLERFSRKDVSDICEPGRANVAGKRFGLFR